MQSSLGYIAMVFTLRLRLLACGGSPGWQVVRQLRRLKTLAYGEINAASIETDGLLGTLQKLQGLDTGQIFKALGTEAGPALLPVIQNLERYEELIKNQAAAQGTAAAGSCDRSGHNRGRMETRHGCIPEPVL